MSQRFRHSQLSILVGQLLLPPPNQDAPGGTFRFAQTEPPLGDEPCGGTIPPREVYITCVEEALSRGKNMASLSRHPATCRLANLARARAARRSPPPARRPDQSYSRGEPSMIDDPPIRIENPRSIYSGFTLRPFR